MRLKDIFYYKNIMKKGFILIELLVVISLLGILVIIGSFWSLRAKDRAIVKLTDIEIRNIKESGRLLGVDLDDYKSNVYNCKADWLEGKCEFSNGKWTMAKVTHAELREHGYLEDKSEKWNGFITINRERNNEYNVSIKIDDNDSEYGNETESDVPPIIQIEPSNFVVKLMSLANSLDIDSYKNGNKEQMFTFHHPETLQVGSNIEYRFIGSSPNNYVKFNDELWRVIGVFPVEDESGVTKKRAKLISSLPIGYITASQDQSTDSSKHTNEWPGNYLHETLNISYYNNTGLVEKEHYYSKGYNLKIGKSGLTSTSQNMIGNIKYYLGGSELKALSGEKLYGIERGTEVAYSTRSLNVTQKVGVMYPSDYIYTFALGVDTTCFGNMSVCESGNPRASWMSSMGNVWTLTPSNGALVVKDGFFVKLDNGNVEGRSSTSFIEVYPVVYLNEDILTTEGDGEINTPYILSEKRN